MLGASFKEPPKWIYEQKVNHPGDILLGITGQGQQFMALSFNEDSTKIYGQALHADPVSSQGAVYEAELVNGQWTATAILTSSTSAGDAPDYLGFDGIATHENYLFASAKFDDDTAYASGAVFVFHSSSAGWVEVQKITAAEPRVSDFFGTSPQISSDGRVLICSAQTGENPNNGSQNTGVVHVFHSSSAGWDQVEEISGPAAEARIAGAKISADGSKIVACSHSRNEVYVYESGSSGYSLVQTLSPSDAAEGGKLGRTVEISPDCNVIISSNYQDSPLGAQDGSVYVFMNAGSGWQQTQKLLPTTAKSKLNARFGQTIHYMEKVTGASTLRSLIVSAPLMAKRPFFHFLYSDALGRFTQVQEEDANWSPLSEHGNRGLAISPKHDYLAVGNSFYGGDGVSQEGTIGLFKWSDEY